VKNKTDQNKGFTLIEILVVVSIISLLSSIVISAVTQTRTNARDSRRLTDLKQLNTALALYQLDHGSYPVTFCQGMVNGDNSWAGFEAPIYANIGVCAVNSGPLIYANLTEALKVYVKDPKLFNNVDDGALYNGLLGQDYKLMIWRTPENMKNFPNSVIDYNRCGTIESNGQCSSGENAIGIWTPGAEWY
jgi:prepilin-type N-terminal cleavage/methylation domain-containing protein